MNATKIRKAISILIIYLFCSYSVLSLLYYLIDMYYTYLQIPIGVFGFLPRMIMYHYIYPYQYIFVCALSYSVISTAWAYILWRQVGVKRFLSINCVIILSIILSSIPGGILWVIHDMQAGFFPSGVRFWKDIYNGALHGLSLGWLLTLLSIPYNIIGHVIGLIVTSFVEKSTRTWRTR